jgi:hypothetical protein
LKGGIDMNTSFKHPVALLIRDNDDSEKVLELKKKVLTDYCKQNGYKIVKTFIMEAFDLDDNIRRMIEIMQQVDESIQDLIVYDLRDLTDIPEQLVALFEIATDYRFGIQSVTDGILNYDVLLGVTIHYNVHNNDEYNKNRKWTYVNDLKTEEEINETLKESQPKQDDDLPF